MSGANVTTDLFRVFGLAAHRRARLHRRRCDARKRASGRSRLRLLERRFGGDRAVSASASGRATASLTIVGVASPDLKLGLTEPDVYTPLTIDPSNPGAVGSRSFECYARLRPGIALAEARAELERGRAATRPRAPARSRIQRIRHRPAGLSRPRGKRRRFAC